MKVQLQPNMAAKVSIQSPRGPLSRSVIKGEQAEGEKRVVHPKSIKSCERLLPTSEGRQPTSKHSHHAFRPPQPVTPQYEILDTQLLPKRQTVRGPGLPISRHKSHNRQCMVSTTIKDLKPLSNCTDRKAKPRQRRHTQPGSDLWLELGNDSISAVHEDEGISKIPGGLRLDIMVLAPGVSLSKPQGLQMSPRSARTPVPLESTAELRPMRRYPALPMFTTQQGSTGGPAQPTPHSRRL